MTKKDEAEPLPQAFSKDYVASSSPLPPEQSIHRLFELAIGPLADFHLDEIALPVVKERRRKRAGPLIVQSGNEGVLAAVVHDVGCKIDAELLECGTNLRFKIVEIV